MWLLTVFYSHNVHRHHHLYRASAFWLYISSNFVYHLLGPHRSSFWAQTPSQNSKCNTLSGGRVVRYAGRKFLQRITNRKSYIPDGSVSFSMILSGEGPCFPADLRPYVLARLANCDHIWHAKQMWRGVFWGSSTLKDPNIQIRPHCMTEFFNVTAGPEGRASAGQESVIPPTTYAWTVWPR